MDLAVSGLTPRLSLPPRWGFVSDDVNANTPRKCMPCNPLWIRDRETLKHAERGRSRQMIRGQMHPTGLASSRPVPGASAHARVKSACFPY